jgi:hypothetical protein
MGLTSLFHRGTQRPTRIILTAEGFELSGRDSARVLWNEVSRIMVFKDNLRRRDLICMEFVIRTRNQIFEIDEKAEGFWRMVTRIKKIFPDSDQDWEAAVLKPTFIGDGTLIYERMARS